MISMSQLEFILSKKDQMSAEEFAQKVEKAKAALDKVSTEVHQRRSRIKNFING